MLEVLDIQNLANSNTTLVKVKLVYFIVIWPQCYNSNTTLVKVKCKICLYNIKILYIQIQLLLKLNIHFAWDNPRTEKNSNTTLVKVKCCSIYLGHGQQRYSNTTLVKVKSIYT